jgi:hypothetical protein
LPSQACFGYPGLLSLKARASQSQPQRACRRRAPIVPRTAALHSRSPHSITSSARASARGSPTRFGAACQAGRWPAEAQGRPDLVAIFVDQGLLFARGDPRRAPGAAPAAGAACARRGRRRRPHIRRAPLDEPCLRRARRGRRLAWARRTALSAPHVGWASVSSALPHARGLRDSHRAAREVSG